MTPAEWKRKAIHAGMGLFALSLRFLDGRAAAACAAAALLFNLFVMPRIGRGIYRDPSCPRDTGIVAYPAMVLLLLLVFRGQYVPIAAAVWAMMAFGDPAAAIVGKTVGGPSLPWNREKTWVGLLSNWAVAGSSGILVFLFVSRRGAQPDSVAILMIGAGIYAFLESVRSGLDDNIVAALPTALAIYQMGMAWPAQVAIGAGAGTRLAIALAVNAAAAILMASRRLVSASGAVAGAAVGFLILGFGGSSAYGLLWIFFLAGTLATLLGFRRKADAGVAQQNEGRRGASHVVANCAVPTALLLLGVPPIGFVAAFGAALSDTLGTEVGALYGRRAFSPVTLRPLPPGTPGAISWAGMAASLGGAALIGFAGWRLRLVPGVLVWVAVLGGVLGALAESVLKSLGPSFRFRLDHDFANALNTLLGALIALRVAG